MDISGTGWKHITMFDRQYSPEKQAEGLAIFVLFSRKVKHETDRK